MNCEWNWCHRCYVKQTDHRNQLARAFREQVGSKMAIPIGNETVV